MSTYPLYTEGPDGWSPWIDPNLEQPYKFACCDCGLVHDLEFRISNRDGGPEFRARINGRSTGQLRRQMRKRGEIL